MISAFGVEHAYIAKARPPEQRGLPYKDRPILERRRTVKARRVRQSRRFANRYPPGEYEVPITRLRAIGAVGEQPGRIAAIKDHMHEHGLQNPVTVSRVMPFGTTRVTAQFNEGRHRVAAAEQLGWKTIRTVVLPSHAAKESFRHGFKFAGKLL